MNNLVNNYGLISVVMYLSKICERVVGIVIDILVDSNILNDNQYGFPKNLS